MHWIDVIHVISGWREFSADKGQYDSVQQEDHFCLGTEHYIFAAG